MVEGDLKTCHKDPCAHSALLVALRRAGATCGLLVGLTHVLAAQWSTSTVAESTLYVCPGFYPGIVTFDDGSSIVLGALESFIYAQKLDEYGYAQWSQPVLVHQDSESFVTDEGEDWGEWISDGAGGVFVFWYDHRGAYFNIGQWTNNAIYVQHVDNEGNVLWPSGGVLVADPSTGLKDGKMTRDGSGGIIIGWADSEFDFPGAEEVERTKVARLSEVGVKMWEQILDSSTTQYSLSTSAVVRGSDRVFIKTTLGAHIVDTTGQTISNGPLAGYALLIPEGDSLLYGKAGTGLVWYDSLGNQYAEVAVTRFQPNLDTLWSTRFSVGIEPSTLVFEPFVEDGVGGAYCLRTINETKSATIICKVQRFSPNGEHWADELTIYDTSLPTGGSDKRGGFLMGDWQGRVWRYDSLALPLWPSEYVEIITDPLNTYFRQYSSDNNGGMIMVYWTTIGGIFAQHSGRNGQVGIITNVEGPGSIPFAATLHQNFPNPFNPLTTIRYELPRQSEVSLILYDVLGREVLSLVESLQEAGYHEIALDATHLATGIYFYRLTAGSFTDVKKLLVIK